MPQHLDELFQRLAALQEEIEEEYRVKRDDIARKRAELAGEFLAQQRRYKIGALRFLLRTRHRH